MVLVDEEALDRLEPAGDWLSAAERGWGRPPASTRMSPDRRSGATRVKLPSRLIRAVAITLQPVLCDREYSSLTARYAFAVGLRPVTFSLRPKST
jgi:hypothetical protein